MTRLGLLVALSLFAGAFGCNTNLAVDPEGLLCDAANACPSGYDCLAGVCRRQSACAAGGCNSTACTADLECVVSPANTCLDGATLRAYDSAGTCDANKACAYSANDVTCAQGCTNGSCVGEPCAGIFCNFAPAPTCLNLSTLRTYAAGGTCQNGLCAYPTTDVNCVNGCEASTCKNQDLCAGVSCNQPPENSCVGGNIRTYSPTGSCTRGTGQCSYSYSETSCGGVCVNGQCKVGLTYQQTGPAIRHQVNAVDQAPGLLGKHALAVGPGGRVAKWNGVSWTELASGTTQDLNAVWLVSDSLGWVAGSGKTLLKYTGSSLIPVSLTGATAGSNLVAVHGASASHAVVADGVGNFWRYDGSSWSAAQTLNPVDGPYQITSVYSVSVSGSVYERLGGRCGSVAPKGCVSYYPPNGPIYVDKNGAPASTTAATSALGPSVDAASSLSAFVGSKEAAEVLRHNGSGGSFDGSNVPNPLAGHHIAAISDALPTSGQAVYVLTTGAQGTAGHLYRYTNTGFNPPEALLTLSPGSPGNVQSMSRNSSNGVIVANSGSASATVYHRGVGKYALLDLGENWVAAALGPAGQLVLINQNGDLATRSLSQSNFDFRPSGSQRLSGLAVATDFSLVVGASGKAFRVSATDFTPLTTGVTASLNAACRASDTELYAVGDQGTALQYNGIASSTLSLTTSTSANLRAAHCPAPGKLVACGEQSSVLKLSGNNLTAVAPALPVSGKTLTSCVLTPAGTIYVAGDGVFARFENGVWSILASQPNLSNLQFFGQNEVYATSNGAVVRFNGVVWSTLFTAPYALSGGTSSAGKAVFVGLNGSVVEGQ